MEVHTARPQAGQAKRRSSPPTVNGDFYRIGTLGLRDCMHSITVNVTVPIANEEILTFDRYRG